MLYTDTAANLTTLRNDYVACRLRRTVTTTNSRFPLNVMKSEKVDQQSATDLITQRIEDLGDWRGETLARMRKLIHEADPDIVEEWKWRGTPTWSHDGIVCTGESYKKAVKLTFAKGASIDDPAGLFNASLDGNVRRAIDIAEGEKVNARDFKALIKRAVALNVSRKA